MEYTFILKRSGFFSPNVKIKREIDCPVSCKIIDYLIGLKEHSDSLPVSVSALVYMIDAGIDSTRRARIYLSNLRAMGVPIVSNSKGVYLASHVDEVRDFVGELANKARNTMTGYARVYRGMAEAAGSDQLNLDL